MDLCVCAAGLGARNTAARRSKGHTNNGVCARVAVMCRCRPWPFLLVLILPVLPQSRPATAPKLQPHCYPQHLASSMGCLLTFLLSCAASSSSVSGLGMSLLL